MSISQPVLQPVKVSELLGIPKSSDKQPVSERKRLEPVKVKDLLVSCSKTAPSSEGHVCRRTFVIPKSGRKPVRRALYEKSSSPHQSPDRCNTTGLPLGKILAKKSQRKSRKSCLPPPNSIAQRHIQKVINGSIQNSVIIKELCESFPDEYPQPAIIKEKELRYSQHGNERAVTNLSITVPSIVIAQDITTGYEEVGSSTADKENIPPSLHRVIEPLTKNKADPSENDDPHLVDVWRGVITRIEKVEHNLEEVKTQQAVQIDLLRKIYGLMTIKCESPEVPVSNTHDRLPLQILSSPRSQPNSPKADEHNVISDKMNEVQLDETVQKHHSTVCVASESSRETYDGFSALEDALNISNKLTQQKSPVMATPKRDRQYPCAKSDRPLREYLVMKASMSFLETPEPHGFKRNTDLNGSGMSFGNKDLRRSISSKLFDELQDLYLDSPGPASLYP